MKVIGNSRKLRKALAASAALTVCLSLGMLLAGCGDKSGGTYDEPEITADYLSGEYAQQLVTDGADTLTGFVTITKDGDNYSAILEEAKIIENSSYDRGYYIADTNLSEEFTVDSDARFAIMKDGALEVVDADAFIAQQDADRCQLYQVYAFDNLAELVIAVNPEDLLED